MMTEKWKLVNPKDKDKWVSFEIVDRDEVCMTYGDGHPKDYCSKQTARNWWGRKNHSSGWF